MSWVTEILTPIITIVVILGFAFWILFIVWKFFKKPLRKVGYFAKYSLLRAKYDESNVKVCMKAIEKGYLWVDLKRHLMMQGKSNKELREFEYVFNKIERKLKGGKEK